MAVESEKAERAKRQRNIVITGLSSERGTSDEELFVKFCAENMTSKPKLIRCQHLGRMSNGTARKLKVTLENDSAVEDLLSSSQLLRESQDENVKKVYFNRDLTPLEAKAAYEARMAKRASGRSRGTMSSS